MGQFTPEGQRRSLAERAEGAEKGVLVAAREKQGRTGKAPVSPRSWPIPYPQQPRAKSQQPIGTADYGRFAKGRKQEKI